MFRNVFFIAFSQKLKITCGLLFLLIGGVCRAQNNENTTYYNDAYFLLEGTQIADSLKENKYDRLPLSLKNIVREPVWNLSKCSSGLSIRFLTNSSSIKVKWTVLNDFKMNHMAETGIKGIDLYYNNKGTFEYLNTARPQGKENEYLLMQNMTEELREFKMFLPLYDGIENIEVGIDTGSKIEKPEVTKSGSILFYGTSITQGGCASRPGMVHTNIISRKLNIECINFGFSGNGMMEQPINELISEFDPLFYVIECLPNMDKEQIEMRSLPLVETIRVKHATTPIIFVENFIYDFLALNGSELKKVQQKNEALKIQYSKMIEGGYKHIYYIEGNNAMGNDHEGTVDGVHFTDLGFIRYADFLIEKFKELGLLKKT